MIVVINIVLDQICQALQGSWDLGCPEHTGCHVENTVSYEDLDWGGTFPTQAKGERPKKPAQPHAP